MNNTFSWNQPSRVAKVKHQIRMTVQDGLLKALGVPKTAVSLINAIQPDMSISEAARQLANEVNAGKRKRSEVVYYATSDNGLVSKRDRKVAVKALEFINGGA